MSNASGYDFHPEFDRQIAYIAAHPEVRDVLLSGGDPLLLSDEKLENLLSRLRAIPHVEFLRIGTRIPDFPAAAHHAGAVRHAEAVSSAVPQRACRIIRAS